LQLQKKKEKEKEKKFLFFKTICRCKVQICKPEKSKFASSANNALCSRRDGHVCACKLWNGVTTRVVAATANDAWPSFSAGRYTPT